MSINELPQPRTEPRPMTTLSRRPSARPPAWSTSLGWRRPPPSPPGARHALPCERCRLGHRPALGRVLRLLQRRLQPCCAAPRHAPAACGPNPAPARVRARACASRRRVRLASRDAPHDACSRPRPHQARHPGARTDASGAPDRWDLHPTAHCTRLVACTGPSLLHASGAPAPLLHRPGPAA